MEIKELVMNKGKGKMLAVKPTNSITCKKYVGKFNNPALQAKADTGLWFSQISGNPHCPTGEGSTPELAITDSVIRTNDLIRKLSLGVEQLYLGLREVNA